MMEPSGDWRTSCTVMETTPLLTAKPAMPSAPPGSAAEEVGAGVGGGAGGGGAKRKTDGGERSGDDWAEVWCFHAGAP